MKDKEKYLIPDEDVLLKHEVLHTSHIINENWDEYIHENVFVQDREELKLMSEKINALIFQFYQEIAQYETKAEQINE